MQPLRAIEFLSASGVGLRIQDRAQPDKGGTPVVLSDARCREAIATPEPNILPALSWSPDPDGLLCPLRLRENAEYFLTIRLPRRLAATHAAADAARASGDPWPFQSAATSRVVRLLPEETWKEEPDGSLLFATANFGSAVGVADLTVVSGDDLFAEIAASKIDYDQDFKDLLSAVANELIDLMFQVGSVAGLKFASDGATEARPAVVLFHLRRYMRSDALPAALEAIVREPLSRLVSAELTVPPTHAPRVDPELLASRATALPMQKGGPLAALFRGHTPEKFVVPHRRDTVDVPENRYVKAFAEDLALLCRDIAARLPAKAGSGRAEAERWAEIVDDIISAPLWREVGPLTVFPANSQALLRLTPYREVLHTDLQLRTGLALPWERAQELADTIGDLRPIFELYEYWCFFIMRRIIRELCGNEKPVLGDLIVARDGGLSVDLRHGKRSRLQFRYEQGARPLSVDLFYNRSFQRPADPSATFGQSSYSTQFRPDYSLRIKASGTEHWLHFDAKYKLDLAAWRMQLAADDAPEIQDVLDGGAGEDRTLFKKVDLYKVHAYRDAILGSRGAFVLFPGDGDRSLFVRHRDAAYRAATAIPSVGAFPLRPGSGAHQLDQLRDFITSVLDRVADPTLTYREEVGFA
jgi:predicted component of viral defense system (DUF524 family)